MGLDRRLMCLLPVRNGAVFLPRYFDCVRTFCSGIIALDDGSTDNTGVLLKAEPMVKALLTNCPRPSYKGWNDSQNRQRLLDACADFSPEWVIWIDADEVIPASDIPLLMHFIDTDARPEQVYGFEVLRMIGDGKYASDQDPGRCDLPLMVAQAAAALFCGWFAFQFQGSRSAILLAG